MLSHSTRWFRWLVLIASGAIVFQTATSCDQFYQAAQTGLLGILAGTTYYLAKNV